MSPRVFAFGPFVLDTDRGSLTREGRLVAVGQKGLLLLQAFLQAPGQVLTKAELMEAAWPHTAIEESNLSVQIAALRKLLAPPPDGGAWITTIPRGGYRFTGSLAPRALIEVAEHSADVQPRPSIAVLPFTNVSGDTEQEYLADGITEDIITALTRFRWFRVISRNSSFAYRGKQVQAQRIAHELGVRYLLEGSVRKSDQRVRISAQLIEAISANHIWAERYDLQLTEAFAVQDAIAERVAGAIEPELLKTESLPTARHTGNMTAWDLVRQGTWQFHHVGRETHLRARDLFRQACKLDPDLAEAHIWLGRVSAGLVAYGWSDKPAEDIREGLDAALKAIHLDEKNPYSHYALAICSVYANAPEQAIVAAEKAVEISPSYALGHLVLGLAKLFRGDARDASASLEHGLTLNAYDPQNFVWYSLLASARLFDGDAEGALAAAVRGQKIRPTWQPNLETLACCYAALDRMEEARRCIEQADGLEKPTGDVLAPLRARNPRRAEHMIGLLRQARSKH